MTHDARPPWMWPVVEDALRGATAQEKALGVAKACFGWLYHNRDADGRVVDGVCPSDGVGAPLCAVRGLCQAAVPAARHAEKQAGRWVPDDVASPVSPWKSRVGVTPLRQAYRAWGRPSDRLLHGFLLALGGPPVVYDRRVALRTKSAEVWAKEHMGPLWAGGASSYHRLVGWREGPPGMYLGICDAWTNSPTSLRVDLMPELALAVSRDDRLRDMMKPIQRQRAAAERMPGARFRVLLHEVRQVVTLAEVVFREFGYRYEDVVKHGALWRGEATLPEAPKVVVPTAPKAIDG